MEESKSLFVYVKCHASPQAKQSSSSSEHVPTSPIEDPQPYPLKKHPSSLYVPPPTRRTQQSPMPNQIPLSSQFFLPVMGIVKDQTDAQKGQKRMSYIHAFTRKYSSLMQEAVKKKKELHC